MSNNEFLNKRILITGGSSGIGQACAMYFLNQGAKVCLCGRDIATLKKIGKKFPSQVSVVDLDLSDDLLLFDLKSTVVEILGGIEIIINCAGVQFDGDIEKTFPQDYDYTIDVNMRSNYLLLKSFKMYLNRDSCIVNVSGLYGTKPSNGLTSLCISKAGLEMLTKFAAAEFAIDGVRVNAVSSCPVDTNSQRYVGVSDKEFEGFKLRVDENIPLGRMANPEDVAKAIIFLASPRSSKITGQIMKVDGGRSLTTSGWVPWRGMGMMNSRFEPDGMQLNLKLQDVYSKYVTGKPFTKSFYPTKREDIDKLINESNWATNLIEAHAKVSANYKNIEPNDQYLQKFVK